MALPRFFKLPNHRVFDYQPRYYDERKEELDEIKRNAEIELGINNNKEIDPNYRPNIKGKMSQYHLRQRRTQKGSNIRLAIILLLLCLLAYYLIWS